MIFIILNMLLICSTFYCLSNICLLIGFLFLTYKYIKGLIIIFYDQNQILDKWDKTIYILCLLNCLIVTLSLLTPSQNIQYVIKIVKLSYQSIIFQILLKLTQFNERFPKSRIFGYIIFVIVLVISILNNFKPTTFCIDISEFILSIGSFTYSIFTLYLGIYDLKQIRLVEQQRMIQSNKGLTKIIYAQITKRKIYLLVIIISSFLSSFFLFVVDIQLISRNVCLIESQSIIPETIGNIFSYLIIYGLQSIGIYYLMIWRNYKYLIQKAQQQQCRRSDSVMIELQCYQRL